jgi:hypothetical protein
VSIATATTDDDLQVLLSQRLRRTLAGSVLQGRTATVVFDSGDAQWTVELGPGGRRVRYGATKRPTLLIRGSREVLADVISGRASGVHAFLDHQVTVRGNLALSLQLDGLFEDDDQRPDSFPRAKQVVAMGVRTSYLEAGPADAPPVVMLHGLGATNASLLPCPASASPQRPGRRTASPGSPPGWRACSTSSV